MYFRNEKQGAEFMKYIAESIRKPLKMLLQDVPFIAMLCDGSTDTSIKEQEACYIHTCHRVNLNVFKGEIL